MPHTYEEICPTYLEISIIDRSDIDCVLKYPSSSSFSITSLFVYCLSIMQEVVFGHLQACSKNIRRFSVYNFQFGGLNSGTIALNILAVNDQIYSWLALQNLMMITSFTK